MCVCAAENLPINWFIGEKHIKLFCLEIVKTCWQIIWLTGIIGRFGRIEIYAIKRLHRYQLHLMQPSILCCPWDFYLILSEILIHSFGNFATSECDGMYPYNQRILLEYHTLFSFDC